MVPSAVDEHHAIEWQGRRVAGVTARAAAAPMVVVTAATVLANKLVHPGGLITRKDQDRLQGEIGGNETDWSQKRSGSPTRRNRRQ